MPSTVGKGGSNDDECQGVSRFLRDRFFVAVLMGSLIRYTGMDGPDWVTYFWPTFFILGGISGHASVAAEVMAIGIAAFLNGMLYGILGWLCFRLISLARSKSGSSGAGI
jgi:hypothetical protein